MEHTLHDKVGGYLLSHRPRHELPARAKRYSVTISREAGAGGSSVAQRLAGYLEKRQPRGGEPWQVIDQNLVGKALEQHRLPKRLEEFMREDAAHLLPDTVEDLLGLHPASSELVRRVSETIRNLARDGNVILIGRGAHLVTAKLAHVFHVRLVAPLAVRLENVRLAHHLSAREAEEFIARTDRARKRYLRQNFRSRVEDPLSYDIILNTGRMSYENAAEIVGDIVLRRLSEDFS